VWTYCNGIGDYTVLVSLRWKMDWVCSLLQSIISLINVLSVYKWQPWLKFQPSHWVLLFSSYDCTDIAGFVTVGNCGLILHCRISCLHKHDSFWTDSLTRSRLEATMNRANHSPTSDFFLIVWGWLGLFGYTWGEFQKVWGPDDTVQKLVGASSSLLTSLELVGWDFMALSDVATGCICNNMF
jgi:hypothetical protein